MSDEWKHTTLGDVATVVGGGTPSTFVMAYWDGDIPWITPTEITAQEGKVIAATTRSITSAGLANSGAKILPTGAVLLTSRATVGAVALAGCPMTTNQGFASLVARPMVLPRYLMYWCQAHRQDFLSRAGGNTFLEISKGKVRDVPIDLPSLGEQRRIVDLIAGIDDTISSAKAVHLRAAGAWEAAIATFAAPSDGDVHVGSVLVRVDAGRSPLAVDRLPSPGERAVLKVSAVERNEFNPEQVKTVPGDVALPLASRVEAGDILVTRANGVLQRVGQVCRVRTVPHDYYLCDKTLRLVPRLDAVDPAWLTIALLAPSARAQIEATTGGSHMRNITQEAIRAVRIPLPDLVAQRDMASVADAVDAVRTAARGEINHLRAVRRSLLTDLLSGAHEIPETYDALLEAS